MRKIFRARHFDNKKTSYRSDKRARPGVNKNEKVLRVNCFKKALMESGHLSDKTKKQVQNFNGVVRHLQLLTTSAERSSMSSTPQRCSTTKARTKTIGRDIRTS